MKTMFVGVARARKDAKALSHAIKCETISLGGIRSAESVKDLEIFDCLKNKIPLFFAGREDVEIGRAFLEEVSRLNPLAGMVVLSKKAVRNTRMEEIRKKFEIEKAKLRLCYEYSGVFRFSRFNGAGVEIHPDYDSYFITSEEFAENMSEVFKVEFAEGGLVIRKLMNEEWIYNPELKAVVSKKIGEECRTVLKTDVDVRKIPLKRMAEDGKNREFLAALERVAINFIRENAESGNVAVPFSGGKDSLASLILARKAFPDSELKAIYVRTNYELPYTEEYVESVCEKLGVELIVVDAVFSSSIKPALDSRVCTKFKMERLREAVRKIGNPVLIAGDRDAESRIRRERPEVVNRVSLELFPVKYWSGSAVQLYSILNGVELHPLYYAGFYRIGCSICPSMSDWERYILGKLNLKGRRKIR